MYLRPRSIFEKFLVSEKISRLDERGREVVEFKPTGEEIFCVVSKADSNEREKLKSLKHEVSHVLVQRYGRAQAKVGDLLICGTRNFIVEAVDNPAALGFWFLYYCTERFDL